MLHDDKTQIKTPASVNGSMKLSGEDLLKLMIKLQKLKKMIGKQGSGKAEKPAQKTDFYTSLKKAGFGLEQKLNQHIQNKLNAEDLVALADNQSDWMAGQIKSLQKYIETLSTILLFPTKNDVANLTKLIIQTEEKVDQLEVSMLKLEESMEEIKTLLIERQGDGGWWPISKV